MEKRSSFSKLKNRRLGFILLSVVVCFFFGIIFKEVFLGKTQQALVSILSYVDQN